MGPAGGSGTKRRREEEALAPDAGVETVDLEDFDFGGAEGDGAPGPCDAPRATAGSEEEEVEIEDEDEDEDEGWVEGGEKYDEDVWEDPSASGVLTELFAAVESGNTAALQGMLARLDVPVDTPGPEGETALQVACMWGRLDAATALLAAGADASIRDEDDGTLLHDAAAVGAKDLCLLLLRAVPSLRDATDLDGDTPLHSACRGNHPEVVHALIQAGAEPRENGSGQMPCALATASDVTAIFEG